ncbi:MAG: RNA 2',3'-cyclic phosphodiesterase [Propionibacteriaceae bacterium]|jgi:2'-5' RNA ligase|nr:RNA 2',3'-cyclic phosphodiesterase [Propionibacteriaceae bacterium]
MTRLFVAVAPPSDVVERLEGYVGPRRDAVPGWRWSAPENWHITLAFLGEVDDESSARFVETVRAASPAEGFPVRMGGAGFFGDFKSGAPVGRQVWLGCRQGADELAALSAKARQAASRSGVKVDGGKFTPHLTLARCSHPAPVRGLLEVVDSFGDFDWTADGCALYSSTLTPTGPIYRAVADFPLAQA